MSARLITGVCLSLRCAVTRPLRCLLLFSLTGLTPVPPATLAQEPVQPTVGLVLSGGGAKGAAHVGVIKVLEELGVRVDVVVGTSMGSIVGGLYASGLSGSELEAAIASIDWDEIFDDDPPRRERSFRRKQDDSEVLIRYRLGVKDGSVRLPSGIIIGQKLGLTLRRLAAHTPGDVDFDTFPRRYRAVAADLVQGEPVVIGSGSLARAMHASMSVPGVFPPVDFDGRLLVDGGIVNNVPIDVARSLGVDRLIVVTLLSEPISRDDLYDAVKVAEQSINLMIDRETRRLLATLTPDDIVINPALGDLSSADFERSQEAIELGEAAARQQLGALAALARIQETTGRNGRPPPGTGATARGKHEGSPRPPTIKTIASIRIENDTPLDDAVLSAKLTLQPGDALDLARLEQDISDIYGLGYFETVEYRLEERAEGTDVVIVASERVIGLGTLRFGLTLESDFDGGSAFNFVTEYQALGLNARGGEWRSALVLGENVFVGGEFYQPLDLEQRWFFDAGASYNEFSRGVFDGGRRTSEFRIEVAEASFDVGRAFSNCCELRAGVRFGAGESRVQTGPPGLRGGSFQIGSLTASAGYDTLDNPRFPGHGASFRVSYEHSLDALGASNASKRLQIGGAVARSFGHHTLLLRAELGTDIDDDLRNDANVQNLFSLGGLFNLSGLTRDEISGENRLLGTLFYYQRRSQLGGLTLPLPLYMGGSLEFGGVYDDLGDIGGERDIFAGSLFLGADTALGPFYFAYGQAEGGNRSLYVFLGRTF